RAVCSKQCRARNLLAQPAGGLAMRLRVRTERWTTMFFAALELAPVAACGGATTLNVRGNDGTGGSDTSSGAGSSTTGATGTGPGGSSVTGPGTTGTTTTGTTGTGTSGTGGGFPFPCYNPTPVINPSTGYVSCANGSIHRPVKATCPTTVPRPGFIAPDAGFN